MARVTARSVTYDDPRPAELPDFWLEHLGPKRLAFEMYRAGKTEQEIIRRTGVDTIDMQMNACNG